ncbi:hypothetical protein CXG81DRAFT_2336, partial [Caulochytrium protostelioides]
VNKPVRRVTILGVVRIECGAQPRFVYLLEVTCIGEATPRTIYLAFEDLFDFHLQLIGHFPEECGQATSRGSAETRPPLQFPGQVIHITEAVAYARIAGLQTYLTTILTTMPAKITRSPLIMNLFR